jgi:hypothetical protein
MIKDHEKLMQGKILNDLSDEEATLFDFNLATDDDFRKEYEVFSQLFSTMKDEKAKNLRSKLDSIYNEMYVTKKETKMIQLIKQNWYSVAAAVAVLIMIGAYWFSGLNQQAWNEQLYDNYYQEDEVFVNTRSEANFDVDVLHLGMEFLEKKEFSAALTEFNKLPASITANYYAGVANMELNKHQVAVSKFDYVIDDYLNLFYDQAQWYKGLCLVKLEKKSEAIELFNQISNTESYFKDKAKQIVIDLRKN